MATKRSGTRSSTAPIAPKKAPETSRKTVQRQTAAYARKADDDSDDKGKKPEPSAFSRNADDDSGDKSKTSVPATVKAESTEVAERAAKPEEKQAAAAPAKSEAKDAPGAAAPAQPETAAAAPAKSEAKDAAAPAVSEAAPPTSETEPRNAATHSAASYEVNRGDYAVLLSPAEIGDWDPSSPAPAPGKAPPGDSRSFRRMRDGVAEFMLIYRHNSYLITRSGEVGVQGTWQVVEYPYIGSASHAYAQECSVLTAAGYRDLR